MDCDIGSLLDYENSKKYDKVNWIGLTIDEATLILKEMYNGKVSYEFVEYFRETEEYQLNNIEFKVEGNKIVNCRWG